MRRSIYNNHHHYHHSTDGYNLSIFPIRPVRRYHRISVLGFLFIAAISPSFFLLTLHQFELNIVAQKQQQQQQQQFEQTSRKLRHEQHVHDVRGGSSSSGVSSSSIRYHQFDQHSPRVLKDQSRTTTINTKQHLQSYNTSKSNQSCIILFIAMKNSIGNLYNHRNLKKQMKISNMTLHHYFSATSNYITNVTNVIILTDNVSIMNMIHHNEYQLIPSSLNKRQQSIHSFLLPRKYDMQHKPEFIAALQLLPFISSCTTIIHGGSSTTTMNKSNTNTKKNDKNNNPMIMSLATLLHKIVGNDISLINIDQKNQFTTKQKNNLSILRHRHHHNHPIKLNDKLYKISKIGLLLCRLLSGNRQGICNRWFQ